MVYSIASHSKVSYLVFTILTVVVGNSFLHSLVIVNISFVKLMLSMQHTRIISTDLRLPMLFPFAFLYQNL